MTPLRSLVPVLFVVAAATFAGGAVPAFAAACDTVRIFTLETAQKSAWETKNWESLYAFNIEEAKYTDSCGHKEGGAQQMRDLQSAAVHYNAAGGTELGRKWFDLAKKHFERSNQIIAQVLRQRTDANVRDMLEHYKMNNDDGIKRAARHQSTMG